MSEEPITLIESWWYSSSILRSCGFGCFPNKYPVRYRRIDIPNCWKTVVEHEILDLNRGVINRKISFLLLQIKFRKTQNCKLIMLKQED